MDLLFKIALILFLVFLNAFFVAAEFALVAVRKTRIDELVRQGRRRAVLVQLALKELDTYISATQFGITLASLGLGWVGEPAMAGAILPIFSGLPTFTALISAHTISVVIAFSLITFLHIVIGELVPKTIALQKAEPTTFLVIVPLIAFTKLFWPFIIFLNNTGRFILKRIGMNLPSAHESVHSEEEIKLILDQSGKGGIIPENEVEMMRNVFKMGDMTVRRIMVPRTDIIAFEADVTLGDMIIKIEKNLHSRYPVYKRSIDRVIGFIHVKDVYYNVSHMPENTTLSNLDIIRGIIHLPERKKAILALRDMRRNGIHMAVVNDEYGGTAGIVTMENIIEGIVGDIEDEFDKPKRFIRLQKDKSYLVAGQTPIERVERKTKIRLKNDGYTTIGGLLFGLLGREPTEGDSLQIGNVTAIVEEVKGGRITLVRLKQATENPKTIN